DLAVFSQVRIGASPCLEEENSCKRKPEQGIDAFSEGNVSFGKYSNKGKHALKGKIDEDRYQRKNEAYPLPLGPDDHDGKVEGEENDQHLVGAAPRPCADEEEDCQQVV